MTIYPRTSDDLVKQLREADDPLRNEAAKYIEQLDRDWINLKNVAVANMGELLANQAKIAKLERAVSVLRYLHAHADLKKQARKSIQVALAELEKD